MQTIKDLPLTERVVQAIEAVLEGRYSTHQAAIRWNVPGVLLAKRISDSGQTPKQGPGIGIILDPIPFAVPKVTELSETDLLDRIGEEVDSNRPNDQLDLMTEASLPELQRLERQYDRCLRLVRSAMESGNGNATYKHEANLINIGVKLDLARSMQADAEARRAAAEVRDPVELAGKLLNQLDKLVGLAPEAAKTAYERLKTVFGP